MTMTLDALAGFIALAITLVSVSFIAGQRVSRWAEKRRPKRAVTLDPNAAMGRLVEESRKRTPTSVDIIGYSVHTIYRNVAPLVEQALRNDGKVRILALDPTRLSIAEKSKLEHPGTGLDLEGFLNRSSEHIEDTVRTLSGLTKIIAYQTGRTGSQLSFRVYDAPTVYRGVIADRLSVSASYLDELRKSSRDAPMTLSWNEDDLASADDRRLREWFDYVWKYRSRPHATKAVVFDLYDTLVHIDPDARLRHQSKLAESIGIGAAAFIDLWNETSEASNRGEFRTTADRFARIAQLTGKVVPRDVEGLAEMEHEFLRENVVVAPAARELLRGLRQRGYRLGILSNCSVSVGGVLEATELAHYVDAVVLSYTVGMLKPDPRIFGLIQGKLGTQAQEVVYVGDGAGDELVAASGLGMRAIQTTWASSRIVAPNGVPKVASFAELARHIDPEGEWHFA